MGPHNSEKVQYSKGTINDNEAHIEDNLCQSFMR